MYIYFYLFTADQLQMAPTSNQQSPKQYYTPTTPNIQQESQASTLEQQEVYLGNQQQAQTGN